jgi:3-hydroxyisobutyrate dehydrogenase
MGVEADSSGAIGIIGLGNMGGRIARRLIAAGHDVIGYDVEPSRVLAAGARAADDIASLTVDADLVLMSLPDSSVIETVALGDGGLLAQCRPGQVVVDLSTAAPRSTVRLHAMFGQRGVEFIDAGISGGAAAAEAGTLTVMAGGSRAALACPRSTRRAPWRRSDWPTAPVTATRSAIASSTRSETSPAASG